MYVSIDYFGFGGFGEAVHFTVSNMFNVEPGLYVYMAIFLVQAFLLKKMS